MREREREGENNFIELGKIKTIAKQLKIIFIALHSDVI